LVIIKINASIGAPRPPGWDSMQRHHQHLNIPVEFVRTVVAISETGSFTKAASLLGLSQPAVSSQMKRIEHIVGGALFSKTPNGSGVTALGKLVLIQAHKILEANDQMLALGGGNKGPQLVRLGLSSLLVRSFMLHQTATSLSDVQVLSDNSYVIAKSLADGHVDIACIFEKPDMPDVTPMVISEFEDQLVWVRSKDFVLSAGAPIPIVTWAGDDWMIRTLTQKGLSYRIVFNGPDYDAKQSAVEKGVGLSALPQSLVPPTLMCAKEYYLPPLPVIKAMLCARPGLRTERAIEIQKQLASLFGKAA
jgi:DNA-binding transcriptional LysR family regulator